MSDEHRVAVGVFSSQKAAERTIKCLREADFPDRAISVAIKDADGQRVQGSLPSALSPASMVGLLGAGLGIALGCFWTFGPQFTWLNGAALPFADGQWRSALLASSLGGTGLGLISGQIAKRLQSGHQLGRTETHDHGETVLTVNPSSRFDKVLEILGGEASQVIVRKGTAPSP